MTQTYPPRRRAVWAKQALTVADIRAATERAKQHEIPPLTMEDGKQYYVFQPLPSVQPTKPPRRKLTVKTT